MDGFALYAVFRVKRTQRIHHDGMMDCGFCTEKSPATLTGSRTLNKTTPDVVYGVLTKFKSCLVELVSTGVAVKLDGLGIFYPTLESKGAETPIQYNVEDYVKGIHIRFTPDNTDDESITSRAFLQKCSLNQRMLFDKAGVPKKVKNGQLVDYDEGDDEDEEQEP